jgi:hypothetical protein
MIAISLISILILSSNVRLGLLYETAPVLHSACFYRSMCNATDVKVPLHVLI